MNERTAQWLRSIKIPPGHINEAQLQNGYIFGLIFDRLNLSKDKKFKNSQDLACIFQNFKNTKDLLYEHFGIAFPANEIIYRSSELLQKVKEACEEYEQNKKQIKLGEIKKKYLSTSNNNATIGEQKMLSLRQNEIKQQSTFNNNTFNQANRTFSSNQPKLPQKILEIQKKLSKYRQEQTRHELLTLQTRKQELDSINQAIQDHRYFQMSKMKMTQEMRKQFEKKVADVVAKTEEKKLERIDKQQQFFRFMKSKKDNFANSLKEEEQKAFSQGLDDFQLNCLRQGIELEHDPNKPLQTKQDNFNSKVMLQRIKDNIKKLERERKQRQKRTNSKHVESQQANLKSQQVWEQNNLIDRLQKNMAKHEKYVRQTVVRKDFENATKEQVLLKMSKKTSKPLPEATQQEKQEFQAQLRANRLVFYDREIQRLEKKDKNLKAIAQQALQSLLYTVIVAEESQKDLNFTYSEWKDLQKIFVNYEVPADDKRKKQHSEIEKKEPKEQEIFFKYLRDLNQFQKDSKCPQIPRQTEIVQLLDELIDQAYPKKALPEKQNLPFYMPLRMGFSGNRLSGKTTQVKKLLSKYPSLILIDPKKILTDALQLARPPLQNEDPKKKKDSKKPQQQTPQRIELKKFGQEILAQLRTDSGQQTDHVFNYDSLDFKYVIAAIRWKLQQSFKNFSPQEILAKYNQYHELQAQRIKEFEKNQEEKNKKKDSKKGPATQVFQQLPIFNEFFYTEGFVLDNVDLSEENLRVIERELNGFVRTEQRLNEEAQRLRQEIGQILPIQKSQIPTNLNKGFFNILIDLNLSQEAQAERNEGRKMDPQTGQIYHPKLNPHPTDVKGLAQRLVEVKKIELEAVQTASQAKSKRQEYYNVFGYDNEKIKAYHDLSECLADQITSTLIEVVQNSLRVEYEAIKCMKTTEKAQQNNLTNDQQDKQPDNYQDQAIPAASQPLIPPSLPTSSSPFLLKKQLLLKQTYCESIIQQLSQLPNIRHSFQQSLLLHQREFLQTITRPDDKANRILTFQDNYNKLLEEKSNIINDKSAINHLVNKLDELYDSLWVSIEGKKNQAISKRKKLISSDWINSEVEKIVEVGRALLQSEMNYLVDMLAFIIVLQLQSEGKTNDPVIDHLCLGVPKQSEPIESVIMPTSKVSPRLQFYISQVDQCLETLPDWYNKKQFQSKTKLSPQLQKLADIFVEKHIQKISFIIAYLKQMVFSYSEEEMCYFKALVNKMDDWIISGIKDENEFTYAIYKDLKASIERITKSQLKDLFPTPITASIKPIERTTHFHQPLPFITTQPSLFDYSSYKTFLQELKCLSFSTNSTQSSESLKINFTRFKEYFNKRKKSKLLSDLYLRLDYDTMQQYLVTENQANFREVAVGMLLWFVNVLDEEGLAGYQRQLKGEDGAKMTLSTPSELDVGCLIADIQNISRQETLCLQHLIFDIMQNEYTHQVSIKDYIELLISFNSLQLFKYGDSLMMLNEQK